MPGWNEDLLAGLSTAPWQPRSLRPVPKENLPKRLRLGLLAAVALLHLLAVLLLLALVEKNQAPPADDAILVDFIEAAPPPHRVAPNETITIRMPAPAAASPAGPARPTPTPTRPRVRAAVPMQAVEAPEPRLYNPDGSLHLPADLVDKLDRQFGDKRQFSYQIPHLDDGKKFFDRPPALVYEETRFEQYWQPDEDALTEVLRKAVEATTREVKMKVPGTNSYVVCKVSMLALGGGCGVLTPGADWLGPQDDPATLNPEEARQCAAWWEQIVGAKTQDAWRSTKQLYERECRKPLLRAPSG